MAFDGSLKFDTKIDTSGFSNGVKSLKDSGVKAGKLIGGAILGAVTAVGALGVASAKVGADFEASMSQVAGTMGITVDEIAKGSKSFELLKESAKKAGATTKYTASESAEALNYLALAGYDAEKAVSALPKVLNLASAGGLELAYASDLVTDSMSALGIGVDDLDMFIDQMAKTAQKSNTNVGQLGEAILTVGGTAKSMAGGVEEMNTALGILANNGIKGSEGGTALRNVLLSLTAPTNTAKQAMEQLGLEVFDAQGNILPFNDVLLNLQDSLDGMSDKERSEWISTMFNKRDLKSVEALLGSAGNEFETLMGQIKNSDGVASAMAETLQSNLKGSVEKLKSALEGLGIEIYENMDTPLNGVVETLNGYVNSLSDVLVANEKSKDAFNELGLTAQDMGDNIQELPTGFSGMALVLGDILSDMVSKVAETAPKFIQLGVDIVKSLVDGLKENAGLISSSAVDIGMTIITGIMDMIPMLLDLGMELITGLINGIVQALPELANKASEIMQNISTVLTENMPAMINAGIELVRTLAQAVIDNLPLLIESGLQIMRTLSDSVIEMLPEIMEAGTEIIMALLDALLEMLPELISMGAELIVAIALGLAENMPEIIPKAIDVILTLIDALVDNLPLLVEAGLTLIFAIIEGLIRAIPDLLAKAPEIISKFVDTLNGLGGQVLDAGVQMMMNLLGGIGQKISEVATKGIELATSFKNKISEKWADAKQWGANTADKIRNGISGAIGNIKSTASSLATGAKQKIQSAWSNAQSWGSTAMTKVRNGITSMRGNIIQTASSLATGAVRGITNAFSGAFQIGSNLVKGIWNGIANVKDWILRKIRGFGKSILNGLKSFFGINSPSLVMDKLIGRNLALGIGAGLEHEMPKVNDDIAKEMVALTNKMKTAVEVETKVTGRKVTANNPINKFDAIKDNVLHAVETIRDTNISGNNFIIREEADITRVARELLRLQKEKERG